MKVTVIMDNSVPNGTRVPFQAEHGFSLLLETGGEKILFDCGQTKAVLTNLSLLGIRPADIDMVIISHGHYDHTGGLFHILQHARKAIPVYGHPNIFTPRFSVSETTKAFIGIPQRQEQLTALGAEWRFVSKPEKINENLWISGPIPRLTEYEQVDAKLMVKDGQDYRRDPLEDDLSLFCLTGENLVVIGGCAHSGMINTIRYAMQVTGAKRLTGWIGGTHLGPAPKEQQEKTFAELAALNPDFIAANHCTSFAVSARLAQEFGERFKPAFVGTVFEF